MAKFDTGGKPIYGATTLSGDLRSEKPDFTVVAVQGGLHLFDSDNKPVGIFPYPHDPEMWTALSIATDEKAQRLFLQSAGTPDFWLIRSKKKRSPVPVYLDELDLKGQVIHSYNRPPAPDIHLSQGWAQQTATLLSPLLPAALGKIHASYFPKSQMVPSEILGEFTWPQPDLDPKSRQLIIVFVLDLALGGVVLGCALHIGFSKPRALGWALLTVGFGLPALFAFRFASDWPTQVHCPQCQATRSISTEKCPNCHQAWPHPLATGIEIFQPMNQPKAAA